ncbi:MAG: Asp-tRNA(Asn)/Glu-tRNA(Gln) amidotransferase subunit GatB [Mycoplasmataceae bacterium]|nr:Asp-tRNA(Asn)/Glu-tRNA(Gln) amidotransferase subunit GatB [Mycoplasmataceae bacterium]
MNNFITTIGIEVHTELNTKTKMFSSSYVNSYDEVNTNINEIDLGLPGSMPTPNKEAVVKAIKLAKALNMKVDSLLRFDRKNYFYQDLPKGYQLTQQYFPIGKDGKILDVNIERIHLEEDTAKQQIVDNKLCLDYNRCGVPLIEIVSKPDIHSSQQALRYLNELKRILIFLNISDGKMEDGSFRADINISVAPIGAKTLGTRAEIKNLNSFLAIEKAIDYEFNRQVRCLLKGEVLQQETRRWDDVKNQTIFMREKSDNIDYHFFREPNIVEIDINTLVKQTNINQNQLPINIKNNLISLGLKEQTVETLLDNFEMYKVFSYINEKVNKPQIVATWIINELGGLLKNDNKSYKDLSNDKLNLFIEMIQTLINQKINGKQAKTIFEKIYLENKSTKQLIKELGFIQITDENLIKDYLQKYVDANKNMLEQYDQRPERVEKFFIGLLMRDTKGQANPNIAIKILKSLMNK